MGIFTKPIKPNGADHEGELALARAKVVAAGEALKAKRVATALASVKVEEQALVDAQAVLEDLEERTAAEAKAKAIEAEQRGLLASLEKTERGLLQAAEGIAEISEAAMRVSQLVPFPRAAALVGYHGRPTVDHVQHYITAMKEAITGLSAPSPRHARPAGYYFVAGRPTDVNPDDSTGPSAA